MIERREKLTQFHDGEIEVRFTTPDGSECTYRCDAKAFLKSVEASRTPFDDDYYAPVAKAFPWRTEAMSIIIEMNEIDGTFGTLERR